MNLNFGVTNFQSNEPSEQRTFGTSDLRNNEPLEQRTFWEASGPHKIDDNSKNYQDKIKSIAISLAPHLGLESRLIE